MKTNKENIDEFIYFLNYIFKKVQKYIKLKIEKEERLYYLI